MISYRVDVTEQAASDIEYYTSYIQQQSGSIETGLRWASGVYTSVETLATMPRRYGIADEQIYVAYELRRLIIGNYLALYHVDDELRVVRILSFRHGAKLPLVDELPDRPDNP